MLARMFSLLVRMQRSTATLESSMEVPPKVKNRVTLQPCNCTTGYSPQRYRCSEKKKHMHPNVHSDNVHSRQTVEGAKMSFNRWMDKQDVIHIYNGILLRHQKVWIPTIYLDVDGTGGYYAEWNMSIGERQLHDLTDMWNLKQTNRGS